MTEARFAWSTTREAYERSKQREPWVFPDLICSSVTMIYGRSNVGKSYLVTSLLLSLLLEDREFLGLQPTDKTKLWRPAILWTDPGSDEEYGDRLHNALPEGVDLDVPVCHIGRTARPEEWEELGDQLLDRGYNFVVLDNLMGATGDTNDAAALTAVFDGLTRLTSRAIPVVVIHHESEKGKPVVGAPPMGLSMVKQKCRAWIQVRQTSRRRLRGGNTALIVDSNWLEQPQEIVAEPMAGPDYRVLSRGLWGDRAEAEDGQPRQRSSDEAEWASYVVEHCQGMGVNKTAQALSGKIGQSRDTWKKRLTEGALSKLLARDGESDDTVWCLAA